jgi:chorismate synthase
MLAAILEGFPAGVEIIQESLDHQMIRRQIGYGAGPRMKMEKDKARIISGIMAGVTTGGPIGLLVENRDYANWQGKTVSPLTSPRPGHADLTAATKYSYRDFRLSLERASARETAVRVAVGALCRQFLEVFGIQVGGYVRSVGEVEAQLDHIPIGKRAALAEGNDVRCPDIDSAEEFRQRIRSVMEARDTLGGVLEIVVTGLPVGLGSHVHWDRKLEARLGAAVLGVQAVKGVSIGPAFANTKLSGTQVQDAIELEGGQLTRSTNRAGGIEGGISNGQPLIVEAAMKPIATTLTPQRTVNLASGQSAMTEYQRSDFCPVPRAVPILEAVIAFVLADALIEKLGGDSIEEMRPRFTQLRQLTLHDLPMDNEEVRWWPE